MYPQAKLVIEYINSFGSISPLEAFADLGITRLSARIYDIKKQGYKVTGKIFTTRNRFGKPVFYKRYYLEDNNDK